MRTKMTFEDILRQDHYRSIINLTTCYQNVENGLRLLHYRWALIKNHDNIKSTFFTDQMNKFFKKPRRLEKLYKLGFIKKDCIKEGKYSNNNLTNFLNKLVDDYKILTRVTEKKDGLTRYKILEDLGPQVKLLEINKTIQSVSQLVKLEDYVKTFKLKRLDKPETVSTHQIPFVLHMEKNILKKCDKEENKILKKHINNVLDAAAYIATLKYKKTMEPAGVILYVESYAESLMTFPTPKREIFGITEEIIKLLKVPRQRKRNLK